MSVIIITSNMDNVIGEIHQENNHQIVNSPLSNLNFKNTKTPNFSNYKPHNIKSHLSYISLDIGDYFEYNYTERSLNGTIIYEIPSNIRRTVVDNKATVKPADSDNTLSCYKIKEETNYIYNYSLAGTNYTIKANSTFYYWYTTDNFALVRVVGSTNLTTYNDKGEILQSQLVLSEQRYYENSLISYYPLYLGKNEQYPVEFDLNTTSYITIGNTSQEYSTGWTHNSMTAWIHVTKETLWFDKTYGKVWKAYTVEQTIGNSLINSTSITTIVPELGPVVVKTMPYGADYGQNDVIYQLELVNYHIATLPPKTWKDIVLSLLDDIYSITLYKLLSEFNIAARRFYDYVTDVYYLSKENLEDVIGKLLIKKIATSILDTIEKIMKFKFVSYKDLATKLVEAGVRASSSIILEPLIDLLTQQLKNGARLLSLEQILDTVKEIASDVLDTVYRTAIDPITSFDFWKDVYAGITGFYPLLNDMSESYYSFRIWFKEEVPDTIAELDATALIEMLQVTKGEIERAFSAYSTELYSCIVLPNNEITSMILPSHSMSGQLFDFYHNSIIRNDFTDEILMAIQTAGSYIQSAPITTTIFNFITDNPMFKQYIQPVQLMGTVFDKYVVNGLKEYGIDLNNYINSAANTAGSLILSKSNEILNSLTKPIALIFESFLSVNTALELQSSVRESLVILFKITRTVMNVINTKVILFKEARGFLTLPTQTISLVVPGVGISGTVTVENKGNKAYPITLKAVTKVITSSGRPVVLGSAYVAEDTITASTNKEFNFVSPILDLFNGGPLPSRIEVRIDLYVDGVIVASSSVFTHYSFDGLLDKTKNLMLNATEAVTNGIEKIATITFDKLSGVWNYITGQSLQLQPKVRGEDNIELESDGYYTQSYQKFTYNISDQDGEFNLLIDLNEKQATVLISDETNQTVLGNDLGSTVLMQLINGEIKKYNDQILITVNDTSLKNKNLTLQLYVVNPINAGNITIYNISLSEQPGILGTKNYIKKYLQISSSEKPLAILDLLLSEVGHFNDLTNIRIDFPELKGINTSAILSPETTTKTVSLNAGETVNLNIKYASDVLHYDEYKGIVNITDTTTDTLIYQINVSIVLLEPQNYSFVIDSIYIDNYNLTINDDLVSFNDIVLKSTNKTFRPDDFMYSHWTIRDNKSLNIIDDGNLSWDTTLNWYLNSDRQLFNPGDYELTIRLIDTNITFNVQLKIYFTIELESNVRQSEFEIKVHELFITSDSVFVSVSLYAFNEKLTKDANVTAQLTEYDSNNEIIKQKFERTENYVYKCILNLSSANIKRGSEYTLIISATVENFGTKQLEMRIYLPEGYEHVYYFQLINVFPKTLFHILVFAAAPVTSVVLNILVNKVLPKLKSINKFVNR